MIEFNKIYHIDCLQGMKLIPDNTIPLTVTSPPYDNLRKYNGYSFEFEEIARELYRVTSDGGIVVWVVGDETIKGDETGTSFKQALYFKQIGFKLADTMIYNKTDMAFPRYGHKKYPAAFEYMFILSKGKINTFNLIKDRPNKLAGTVMSGTVRQQDGTVKPSRAKGKEVADFGARSNVWGYTTGKGKSAKESIAFKHPAIFPEKLAEDHILSWSNEGDVVFDPFMGSGTVAKMALLNNRKYIGFEISKEYIEICEERLFPYIQ